MRKVSIDPILEEADDDEEFYDKI